MHQAVDDWSDLVGRVVELRVKKEAGYEILYGIDEEDMEIVVLAIEPEGRQ